MRDDDIYKILRESEWAELQRLGEFRGSADDRCDGFIHLSTKAQIQGTLDKHYQDAGDIILAEIKAGGLGCLKYEISRGGAEFPHLYGTLSGKHITRHWVLSPDSKGRYAVSEYLAV
jgi:uncharacterized protein (DUF952 family)